MAKDIAVTLGFDAELVEADDASFAAVTLKIADEPFETIIMPIEREPESGPPRKRRVISAHSPGDEPVPPPGSDPGAAGGDFDRRERRILDHRHDINYAYQRRQPAAELKLSA